MNAEQFTRAIEKLAREGYADEGRGLVMISKEPEGILAGYFPAAAWAADPMPSLAGDKNIPHWIATYDPDREFVMIFADDVGDAIEMTTQISVFNYPAVAPAPARLALAP